MKVELMPATELTTEECNRLRDLTFRSRGNLSEQLSYWRYDPRAKVARLTDNNGRVLSWGLAVPYDDRRKTYDVQLYTRKSCRRKGYGSKIFSALAKSIGGKSNAVIHPHDNRSVDFFNKTYCKPLHKKPFTKIGDY